MIRKTTWAILAVGALAGCHSADENEKNFKAVTSQKGTPSPESVEAGAPVNKGGPGSSAGYPSPTVTYGKDGKQADAKAEESKAGDTKKEEPKAGDTKKEEPKAGDKKGDASTAQKV